MRRFMQVDVFSRQAGAGNALAVVLDADGLDTQAMQRLAAWTNLSETTFLLPPTQAGADYRLRIFSPQLELPFAGHPSVGSAWAAIEAGIATPRDGLLRQECAAGVLPLHVHGSDATRHIRVRAPRARLSDADHAARAQLDAILRDVPRAPGDPLVLADVGARWWLAQLADAAAVRHWTPPLAAITALGEHGDALGLAVFGVSTDADHALAVRAFCPGDGIAEDPVTGSANAAIGAWLAQRGQLQRGAQYRASQGRELGRNGFVDVLLDEHDEVWVGGYCADVIRGTVAWPASAAS